MGSNCEKIGDQCDQIVLYCDKLSYKSDPQIWQFFGASQKTTCWANYENKMVTFYNIWSHWWWWWWYSADTFQDCLN